MAVSMLLMLGYMAIRFAVYRLVPAGTWTQWVMRDTIMDVPRILFLYFSWRFARRYWKPDTLGVNSRKLKEAFVLGVLFCAPLFARPYFFPIAPVHYQALIILGLSGAIVAILEEVLFRGLFFLTIREHFGWRWAAFGSAIAFTLFHVQSQPLWGFPWLFLTGFLFALMRAYGVSLLALFAIHAAYNSMYEALQPVSELPPFWALSELLILAYIIGMYWMAYRIKLLKPFDSEAASI